MKLYVEHPLVYSNTLELREYQVKIAREAEKQNTLVILPTGLGKTSIAALVAASMLYIYPSKKVLMMAPTRPLIRQHALFFSRVLRLPVEEFICLTGETTSSIRKIIWLGKARVIFATPQIVWNDIESGSLSLKNFSLVIFDECHRSVREYAYTKVAKHYIENSEYPIILALTASMTHDREKAKEICNNLYIEKVVFLEEDDESVRAYINPVKVEWRLIKLPDEYVSVSSALRSMLQERLEWLFEMRLLAERRATKKNLIELSNKLSEYLNKEKSGMLLAAISKVTQAIALSHMIELLETQGPDSALRYLREGSVKSWSRARLVKEIENNGIFMLLKQLPEHPKMKHVVDAVREALVNNRDSRILIFTQYRDTATKIVAELNKSGFQAARFVGQAFKAEDEGMSQSAQQETLNAFRDGFYRVLVATSVAEEGLDIPEVSLVIFYEPIPSSIRYIQRRGRTGRRTPGSVIIFAAENTSDVAYYKASQQRLENTKAVIRWISSNLVSVKRKIMPKPSPLSDEELQRLYSISGETREKYISVKEEREVAAQLERELNNATREAYRFLIGEGGHTTDEKIVSRLVEIGFQHEVAVAALEKIKRSADISSTGRSVEIKPVEAEGYRPRKVRIESVSQGECRVMIDERWKAKLHAEDYEGPRHLIKKGKEFLALCKLYDEDMPRVVIRQVIREL